MIEFKEYKSKPITRFALEVREDHKIVKLDESTSKIENAEGDLILFNHYEPVNVGDFIVYLNEIDVYHCSRKVFLERNEI